MPGLCQAIFIVMNFTGKVKILAAALLLCLCGAAIGQSQQTTTVKLSTGDCRNAAAFVSRTDTIVFYHATDEKIIFRVAPSKYRQAPAQLENLPVATYRVSFKNSFGQQVEKQVSLTDQPFNTIHLCIDSLVDYSQNTLAKLQDNDTLSIKFFSQGCFHSSASQILIMKQQGRYTAALYKVIWKYVTKGKQTIMKRFEDSLLQTVTLSAQQMQAFTRFENELNHVADGGCTTTDMYEMKSKYGNRKAKDGGCRWDGFFYLQQAFFPE